MSLPLELLDMKRAGFTDTAGRPLFPDYQRAHLVKSRVTNRAGTGTFADGLIELDDNIYDVKALIRYLHSHLGSGPLDIGHLYMLNAGLHNLPLYLHLRESNPLEITQLPPSVVDASRVAAGVKMITQNIIAEFKEKDIVWGPDEILAYANGENSRQRNYFITHRARISCPAPEPMIKEIIDYMIHETRDPVLYGELGRTLKRAEGTNCLLFGTAAELYNTLNHDPLGKAKLIVSGPIIVRQMMNALNNRTI